MVSYMDHALSDKKEQFVEHCAKPELVLLYY